jgi:diguanylate cyclase
MYQKRKSLRFVISLLFIIIMGATFSVIGCIIFSNWKDSAGHYIDKMANDVNYHIVERIENLLKTPLYINEIHHRFIADKLIDIYDQPTREIFFSSVLQANKDEIYSFSYATENGEYYGARRNQNGHIEIMRENIQTGGHSWYYSTTPKLTADKFIKDYGEFDPREREWYIAAKQQHRPVFSPIYQHFVKNDLAISAAYPIYNSQGSLQGVLGTHLILSNINRFLQELVTNRKARAYIIEKKSGELIANSLGKPNFQVIDSRQIRRLTISEISDPLIVLQTYQSYLGHTSRTLNCRVRAKEGIVHITMVDYRKPGLDWAIITAVSEKPYFASIHTSIRITVLLSLLALIGALLIYLKGTSIILKPVYDLIQTTENFSRGDFSQRAKVLGDDDEIGKLANAFNKMADEICILINDLETKVKERTQELEQMNGFLKDKEESIRLLLDSTAEAICGIDNQGCCTFCNSSCIKILGYRNQEDLIGKKMHQLIHFQHLDGDPIPLEDCKFLQTLTQGKGSHVTNEIFWRADGTSFPVEYFSYPQFREGEIVGAVMTFFDITDRKKSEQEIVYLSYHDQLTGLYNRRFFEEELKRLDVPPSLPLALIFADMNGLKLINDSLGHAVGDEFLKRVAAVLSQACRNGDIIARLGGDEFVIILPKTESMRVEQIVKRIKDLAAHEKVKTLALSISCGYAIKMNPEEGVQDVLKKAEDSMYKNKLFESPGARGRTPKMS